MTGFQLMPTGILFGNGRMLPFAEIQKRIAQSELGAVLRDSEKCTRFRRFKPAEMNHAEWSKAIGVNGDDLNHMRRITRAYVPFFAKHGNLDSLSLARLALTETVHDLGEAVTDAGDLPSGTKTESQKQEELFGLRYALGLVLSDFPGHIADTVFGLVRPVLEDPSEPLNIYHQMITHADHMRTGYKMLGRINGDETVASTLRRMCYDTIGSHLPRLIAWSVRHPPALAFLAHQRRHINRAFALVPPNTWRAYPHGEKKKARIAYLQAERLWYKWQNAFD